MLKIFCPDVASSEEIHVKSEGYLIGAVLVRKDFIISNIHGKSQTKVIVENPL